MKQLDRPRVAAGSIVRFVAQDAPTIAQNSRVATFVFSDGSIDRYGDTIDARGWMLDKFMANPVALFGHDSSSVENVIGKARNVRIEGTRLIGDIEFIEASVNPNAESVYQMVKGGYLNAVSVGFSPVEWSLSKDKSRPQGVDFKKQELLEISIVPIPANPSALVQARAAGIDVDRLGLVDKASPPAKLKSLWHVSWLADILMNLSVLEDCVEYESALEEDNSPIPQKITDALQNLGQILIDMTVEEVTELLASETGEDTGMEQMSARVQVLRMLTKASRPEVAAALAYLAPDRGGSIIDMISRKLIKSGRTLSADNEKTLKAAVGHMTDAMNCVSAVVGQVMEPETPEEAAKAARVRTARALAIAHEHAKRVH
jgi:HK97 family phage prohead protease